MSLVNKIVVNICKKQKAVYDPLHPYDYPARRENELKQVSYFKAPKSVSFINREEDGCKYQIISKDSNPKDRTVYYIHGGGFVTGCVDARKGFTSYVADKLNLDCIAVEYPLAPEHPYPEGLDSCVACYKLLLKKYDPKKICLIGESAGGSLVLSTLLRIKDENLPIPAVAFVSSPCVQYDKVLDSYERNKETEAIVTNLSEEVIDTYLKKNKDLLKIPYVTPLYGDFKGLCPIHFFVSTSETLYDDSVLMHERIEKNGVKTSLKERKGMVHAWITVPQMSESRKDLKSIKKIINETFDR